MLGYSGRASHVLVDAVDCHLLRSSLARLRPALIEATQMLASRKSVLEIYVTDAEPGADVAIDGCDAPGPEVAQGLAQLATRSGIARLTIGSEVIALQSQPRVKLGRAMVPLPPRAFLQATQAGEARLVAGVTEALSQCSRVADLFSGAGTFTFPVAERAAVHAVESDKELLFAMEQGRNHTANLKAITAECRDLFRVPLQPDELSRFDGLVLDPPRAGAQAQAAELVAGGPATLAYVSCDPASFARDVAVLSERYEVSWIDVVDQFRWSPHVELVAKLTRRPG